MLLNNKTLFSKAAIRIYTLKKKATDDFYLLDLLRDEIKLLILITLLNQIQTIYANSKPKQEPTSQNAKFIIRKILLSAKRRIFQRLKIDHFKYKNSTAKLIPTRFLIDSENHIGLTLLFNYLDSTTEIQPIIPIQILLEHSLLKLSELLIYDIFLNVMYPPSLLNQWVIDSILFNSYLRKIEIYLRIKLYINNKVLNRTQVIPNTEPVLLLTASGITQKQLEFKGLSIITLCSTFQSRLLTVLIKPLEVVENGLYKCIAVLARN